MRTPRTVRLSTLAGALALGAVLVAGCSDPEPAPAPAAPVPTSAPTSATSAPSASPSGSASPSAGPTATASTDAAPTPAPDPADPDVEPSRPVETAEPKELDEPTRTAGAEVSLVSVRATTITASTPGDSSGPGVVVRLELENTTGKTLDTGFVQVNVTNASGAPGTAVVGSPTKALGGSLRKGASARGTYAFLLDDARSGDVTVAVYVTSGQPVVQFRGRVS